jgi:tetratricopeptide (TPR) repeat protein
MDRREAISPADAACERGRTLLHAGDIEGAIDSFERALALEPDNAWFHWCVVDARGGAIDDDHLAQLERLAGRIDTLPHTQQIDLRFALAAACERVDRIDDAMRHLHAGNALQRRRIDYDEGARMRFFDSLTGLCTDAFVSALRDGGNPSHRPVFVFGMPRSGTTLVEQVLAAHPDVTGGGELTAFESAIDGELMTPGMMLAELPSRLRALAARYLEATDALAGDTARLTDKLPHNFFYAPLIWLAFPNARMIHVRRDPLDTCFSCYATIFSGTNIPHAYDLGELGRYYVAYAAMMERWRALLPADRFLEVHYERLVDDFEAEARRLIEFCGLPWDAASLTFHEVPRVVRTASAAHVRRPLYGTSIGRGRRFAAHLGPLLEALAT